MKKKTLRIVIVIFLIFFVNIGIFYREILQKGIVFYAGIKGIKVDLNIEQLDFDALYINNLKIGETQIAKFNVGYRLRGWTLVSLDKLEIQAEHIEVDELLAIVSQVGSQQKAGSSSEGDFCDHLKNQKYKISVNSIGYLGQKFNLNLLGNQNSFSFSGKNESLKISKDKTVHDVDYNWEFEIQCQKSELIVNIKKGSLKGRVEKTPLAIEINNGKLMIDLIHPTNIILKSDRLELLYGQKIETKVSKLSFQNGAGEYELKKFVLEDKKKITGPVSIVGKYNILDKSIETPFKVFQPNSAFQIKAKGKYSFVDEKIRILFDPQELQFEEPWKIHALFPIVEPITNLVGQLKFNGELEIADGKILPKFKIEGEKLGIQTKYLKIEDLELIHNVQPKPFLASDIHDLKMKSVEYGPKVENVYLKYELKSLDRLLIHQGKFEFQSANIIIGSFSVNPLKRTYSSFSCALYELPLQNLLSLYFDKVISASGNLSGGFRVEVKDNNPLIKGGFLKTTSKGYIKFRPPGSTAPDFKKVKFDPNSMLRDFLYNLEYESLEANFESDSKYDLKLTLRIFGRNPEYLNGKPLKLAVNIDVNLLELVKSKIITYDLPERLKESILKGRK